MPEREGFDSGFPLYEKLVATGVNGDDKDGDSRQIREKVELLMRFKGHVKKELVFLPSIPKYFEALIFVLDNYSSRMAPRLVLLAHSSLCYLVKRVVMQSPTFFDSIEIVRNITVHLFLLNCKDAYEGKNCWVSSVKAFEAIYLLEPKLLAECMLDLCSQFERGINDDRRVLKFLLVIDELLQIMKKHEKMERNFTNLLIEKIINVLHHCSEEHFDVVKLLKDIIAKNFKDQESYILQQIHSDYVSKYFEDKADSLVSSTFDSEKELNRILDDNNIQSKAGENDVGNPSYEPSNETLTSSLESLLLPFQSLKETEKNWKVRQANLIELRKIMRSQFVKSNQSFFIQSSKELQMFECVGRAVLSLRTTLSMTACQTFKDFILLFKDQLDLQILDQMFAILKSLLSTTKKISSTTAFNSLIIMFSNIDFHQKLFHNCLMLMNEKTTVPRNCSSVLLRIFLLRFTDSKFLDNCLVYIEEWLRKGITDAQTAVRESMRVTFWYYYKSYTANAKNFLVQNFSSQLKKAIELSIPGHLNIDYHSRTITPTSSGSNYENNNKNIHQRKYPSYAQPTHSYKASLQRMSNGRSTSEYIPSETNHNVSSRRKISAPPPLMARRSHTIDTQHDIQKYPRFGSQNDVSNMDNSIQIDLTGDFTASHSNTLISKYLNSDERVDESKHIFQNLNSTSQAQIRDGVQMLQRIILKSNSPRTVDQDFDLNYLLNSIRKILARYPQELKPLLSVSLCCQFIPLECIIEIYAVNSAKFNEEFLDKFSIEEILEAILKSLRNLKSRPNENGTEAATEVSLYYMKYKRLIFEFCLTALIELFESESFKERFDQKTIQDTMLALSEIYGEDFQESLYFDCFDRIYESNENTFRIAAKLIQSTSVKLKICEELELRGKNTKFMVEQIVSRETSANSGQMVVGENKCTDDGDNSDTEEIIVDDRKYLEMTMVNVFNNNRSISGGSVVHHDPAEEQADEVEKPINSKSNNSNEAPKLSEITKVVSIYELPRDREPQVSVVDVEGDSKMLDNSEENSVNLSDIFGSVSHRSNQIESIDEGPPAAINVTTPKSLHSTLQNDLNDESRSSSTDLPEIVERSAEVENKDPGEGSDETEREESPLVTLSDRQSKELTQAIYNIELDKNNNDTGGSEGTDVTSELLVQSMLGSTNEEQSFDDMVLEELSTSSLTYYEIKSAIKMIEATDEQKSSFDQMKKAITRIKNRSFTIKHLNYVIGLLMLYSQETSMREWLEAEEGYEELFQLGKILFISTEETSLLPVNMASKSIVLIECLIILTKHLNSIPVLSVSLLQEVWDETITMVTKLRDYSNELYVLLQEMRELLARSGFFSSKSVAGILTILATATEDTGIGIKETFLMETINVILRHQSNIFQQHQYAEVIQTMQMFVDSTHTEWRYASFVALAGVFRLLQQIGMPKEEIKKQFECLSEYQFHIVRSQDSF